MEIRWTSPVKVTQRENDDIEEIEQHKPNKPSKQYKQYKQLPEGVELKLEGDWEIQFNVSFRGHEEMRWFAKEKAVLAQLQDLLPTDAKFLCKTKDGGEVSPKATTLDLVKKGLRSGIVLNVEVTEEVLEVPVEVRYLSGKSEECAAWVKPEARGIGRCVRIATPFSAFCDAFLVKADGTPEIDLGRRMRVSIGQGDKLVVREKKHPLAVWHRGAKCRDMEVAYDTSVEDVIKQCEISEDVRLFSRLRGRFLSNKSKMSEIFLPGDRIIAIETMDLRDADLSEKTKVGNGSFGTVYKVEVGGTTMAVKVFNKVVPLYGLGNRSREITALASMNHPCIVRLLGIGLHQEKGYVHSICMNFCQMSLDKAQNLTPTHKAMAMLGIVMGMIHVHEAGFMHRDLKPGNILVNRSGGRFAINIADFGSCRKGDLNETKTPEAAWAFAPLEYWEKKPYTKKWDVFSFGAIWYWLVTGNLLFQEEVARLGRVPLHVLAMKWAECLREKRPRIPQGVKLDTLMDRCLARYDHERPSFREILAEMKEKRYRIFEGADPAKVREYVEAVEKEVASASQ